MRGKSFLEHGRTLLKLMATDEQRFFRQLCLNNVEKSPFREAPVLASIDPNEFVGAILKLKPEGQRIVFMTLSTRYERGEIVNQLKEEEPWLRRVQELLIEKISVLSRIDGFRIKSWTEKSIDPTLKSAGHFPRGGADPLNE